MFLFGGMSNMAKTYMKLDGDLVPVSVGTVGDTSKEEQTKTVTSPNFASGNVVVAPDNGKVLTQVTVVKDSDLTPENIVKDVEIFGVVGTAETGGGGDDAVYIPLQVVYGASNGNSLKIDSWNVMTLDRLKQHIYYLNTTTNEWEQIPQVSGTWSLLVEDYWHGASLNSIRFSVGATHYDYLSYRYDGTNTVNGDNIMVYDGYGAMGVTVVVYGYHVVKDGSHAESGINTLLNKYTNTEIKLYANGTIEQKPNKLILMEEAD